jgi:hypothetical protein
MQQAASRAATFISPSTLTGNPGRHGPVRAPSTLLAQKSPSSFALEGQGRPQGVIGLEGGDLHRNGTHWRLLLI